MNRHLGPKNCKSNQEGHKPTNSLILGEVCKFGGGSPHFSPKNGKESPPGRVLTIHRHCSEDDFKRYFSQCQGPVPETPLRSQDDGPDVAHLSLTKPTRNLLLSEKPSRPLQKSPKERIAFEQIKPNALKETASTQSQEILKAAPRALPAFMRGRQGDCRYLRLSSPRMHLRRENFKIYSKLGEGKFGKVFMVKEVRTGFVLAMKIVEKAKIARENLLEQFIRELKIQSFLSHPNIIGLYGFFQDETHFYSLMELGCDSQLYSLIEHRRLLSEETTSFIIKNLLEAVAYMHAHRILHRDIKPENIVLIMGNVKVCDFGWAVNKMHSGELRTTFCGTPLYLSPEILQGSRYDEKVDLWAIGILAYELLLGTSPFEILDQCDLQKIITEDVSFPANEELSEEFREFIGAMLAKDPSSRLTPARLLEMEFIRKYEGFETCAELCR